MKPNSQRTNLHKAWLVILFSSVTEILIVQPAGGMLTLGCVLVAGLAILTFFSPWLGVVALFPLAVSVAAPPQVIGAKELAFATLTTVIVFKTVVDELMTNGVRQFLNSFGLPLAVGLVFLIVNFLAAHHNNVAIGDWSRGIVPFLYLAMFIPVASVLRGRPERTRLLASAIAASALLLCGYILCYYALHRLWEYQWYLKVGTELTHVSEAVAKGHPDIAIGPFVERITMLVPSSTDALVPLGLVLGFTTSVFSDDRRERLFGVVLAAVALPAILVTYTRSMLLSPLIVIGLLCIYLLIYRRDRIRAAVALLAAFSVYAVIVIFALGLELAWLNRVEILVHAFDQIWISLGLPHAPSAQIDHFHVGAATSVPSGSNSDDNVSTRLDEYRIAWSMFLNHPLAGNGFGAKHAMGFIRTTGEVLHETVAYVHNWPLYTLMVGGIPGLLAYGFLLLRPVVTPFQGHQMERTFLNVRAGLLLLCIYALFFAVMRLITFNLLIAAAWGITYAFVTKRDSLLKSRNAGIQA